MDALNSLKITGNIILVLKVISYTEKYLRDIKSGYKRVQKGIKSLL